MVKPEAGPRDQRRDSHLKVWPLSEGARCREGTLQKLHMPASMQRAVIKVCLTLSSASLAASFQPGAQKAEASNSVMVGLSIACANFVAHALAVLKHIDLLHLLDSGKSRHGACEEGTRHL